MKSLPNWKVNKTQMSFVIPAIAELEKYLQQDWEDLEVKTKKKEITKSLQAKFHGIHKNPLWLKY